MSKLQDNRTTPQFMAMLEKWAFFLTLNLHFQQIRFLSLKMQLEIRHFFRFAASFISLFWSSLLSFEKYEK